MLGPLQQAAAFEDTLRQNAITAGETGAAVEEMIQRTRVAYERLARETGQRSRDIAAAAASLVAAGLDDSTIQALLPTISRVATGTGATLEDLAQTALQLRTQLGLTAEQMPQAFASLIQAGRDGNFELRDMAREFPAILAAARALGMQGPNALTSLAAALQVARQAAGSSSEAANNVLNALQKLASPEVVNNFRDIGVNLEGVMQDAARRGINPLEALVQKLRERTGGNLFRLQEIFGDRQALMGLLPLIQETERYLRIRDNARRASTRVIDEGFEDRMRGAQKQLDRTSELLEQLHRRFLLVAGTALKPFNDALDRLFTWIDQIDAAYPGLIDEVAAWAAGLLAAAAAIGIIGQVFSFLGAGLAVILGPLQLVFGGLIAIIGVKLALFLGVIALVAGAAYLLWRYWDRIGPFFRDLWANIPAYFRAFVDWVRGWAPAAIAGAARLLQAGWDALSTWFGTFWRETIPAWFTAFTDWVGGWAPGAIAGAISVIEGAWLVLRTWFNTLWNFWVREPFDAFVTWVDGWTNGLASAAIDRIIQSWQRLRQGFRELWDEIKRIFEEIWGPIERAMERAERFFARANEGAPQYQAPAQAELGARMNARGAQRIPDEEWNAPDAAVAPTATTRVVGEIVVRPAPGAEVTDARATTGPVTITPDRGATRSRP
nr:phage tail tape measure protein [Neoroseomonas alba]